MRFLQHVLSNNVESLDPWQAHYTLIPNDNGGLLDDAYLYHPGDEYFLVVNASNREKDWTHLEKLSKNFEIRLTKIEKVFLFILSLKLQKRKL